MKYNKNFKTIQDIKHLQGVKVLLRLDLNVPIQNGKVVDPFRITKAIPTISYLTKRGAKVIILSHKTEEGGSLAPVAEYLNHNGCKAVFVDAYKNARSHINTMVDGGIILLENLRSNPGEEENSTSFAKELASLGDIYVNDAFGVSHRAHASVCAITKFIPSYAGLLFADEVQNLATAFDPQRPFVFVLGGAKFDTKLPLIEKFMKSADHVFVGGALANNFFKEMGYEIGASMVSPENFNLKRYFKDAKLMLPVDLVVKRGSENIVIDNKEVQPGDVILDAGPKALADLKKVIFNARYVLWNGPLGNYEHGYKQPTINLAEMISMSGAMSIVGGGDTLAAIAELGTADKFSFISTAGGAMLDFLANETLPGIDALVESES